MIPFFHTKPMHNAMPEATKEARRPAHDIFLGLAFGQIGYNTSTVSNWEMEITKESVVDMMAASEAVNAIYPNARAKPPRSNSVATMDVKGLEVSSLSNIWTPMVPI